MATAAKATTKTKAKAKPAPIPHDTRRFVSQSVLAEVLQRNRTTIREWTAAGMPCVTRGDGAAGRDWRYDISEVFAWREKEIAKRVRAECAPAAGGDGDHDPNDPLRGIKDPAERLKIQEAYLKLAKQQKYSVNPDAVAAIWARSYREIGNGVMGVPDMAERRMAGFNAEMVRIFVNTAKENLADILSAADKGQEKALRELFGLAEPDDDEEDDEAEDLVVEEDA